MRRDSRRGRFQALTRPSPVNSQAALCSRESQVAEAKLSCVSCRTVDECPSISVTTSYSPASARRWSAKSATADATSWT